MITFSFPSTPSIYVQVLEGVVIKEINEQFLTVAAALVRSLAKRHAIAVLTGAAEKRSQPEELHTLGYGWDWRSRDVKDPFDVVTEVESVLHKIDSRYRIIYDTQGTGPHFHTEFRVNAAALP